MKSLFLVFLFGILIVGVTIFFKGQHNSVNLQYICGQQVGWYDAIFLDPVENKADCEKFE